MVQSEYDDRANRSGAGGTQEGGHQAVLQEQSWGQEA